MNKYYLANRDKMLLRAKIYYRKNRSKCLASIKKYQQQNRDYFKAYNRRYRKTERFKAWQSEYTRKNKHRLKRMARIWREKNRDKRREYRRRYLAAHRWIITLRNARQRCNYKRDKKYAFYGGRGIRCFLTPRQIRYLWFRDNAPSMKRPSIDRIDPDGHYTVRNCRFIEMRENRRRRIYGSKLKKSA